MHLIINKSKPSQTPFAPQWHYHLGYEFISHIDFKQIAKIILRKEKPILKQFPPST